MYLPEGWANRAQKIEITPSVKAHLLAPIDIAAAKLKLGINYKRPKDIDHIQAMVTENLVTKEEPIKVVNATPQKQIQKARAANLGHVFTPKTPHERTENIKLLQEAVIAGKLSQDIANVIIEVAFPT